MIGFPKPSKHKRKDRRQSANRKKLLTQLFEELQDQGIYGCEVCHLEHEEGNRARPQKGCEVMDPAHRHERVDYYAAPDKLWTRNQVIIAGRAHHIELDRNRERREEVFLKLRGEDTL